MPCYCPVPAWRGRHVNRATGKRPVAFRLGDGFKDMPVQLPCGRCVGCVQDRANEWAMRCEHEAKLYRYNWFVTLTYDDANLPPGGSLQPKDLQDFWKRLRKSGTDVRYFACGEYGEQFQRPHYHALCFNFCPPDLVARRRAMDGSVVYESKSLTEIWGLGRVQVDEFSAAAAQYVTNYVRKKVIGSDSEAHYNGRVREFQVMSRRPGIGAGFVDKYRRDIYPDGFVTRPGGGRRRAPRFYDLRLGKVDAKLLRAMKRKRKEAAVVRSESGPRPYVVEESVKLRHAFFDGVKGRPYEHGG